MLTKPRIIVISNIMNPPSLILLDASVIVLLVWGWPWSGAVLASGAHSNHYV